MYVLLTDKGTYFVELFFGKIMLSPNISEALVFPKIDQAQKFKTMLFEQGQIKCSVNTFINEKNVNIK